MLHRAVLTVAALTLLTACADGTGADRIAGPNSLLGNPPPPAFTGAILGEFESSSVDEDRGRILEGLSLSRGSTASFARIGNNPPQHPFRLSISPVIYNADESLTEFWMDFPQAPIPRTLTYKLPKPRKARIVVANGQSFGSGLILVEDQRNGGWWALELVEYTQPYDVFLPQCPDPDWENCLTLNAPITAYFYPTSGPDANSKEEIVYPSAPSTLYFATSFR